MRLETLGSRIQADIYLAFILPFAPVVVEICNTEAALKSGVFPSALWVYGGEEFKPGENGYDRSVLGVEWEPDSRGRQIWTTVLE